MSRDMSYRKPVPVFVPSPPSSPSASPGHLSLSLNSAMRDSIPPLPNDWRDAIQNAVTKASFFNDDNGISVLPDEVIVQGTNRTIGQHTTVNPRQFRPSPSRYPSTSSGKTSSFSSQQSGSRPTSPRPYSLPPAVATFTSTAAQSDAIRKAKLHQNYRPPTPPVPALSRESRIPDDSGLMLPGRLIYPDMPSVQDLHEPYRPRFSMSHGHSYTVSSLPVKWNASVRTLLANNNADVDMLDSWQGTTLSDAEMGWVTLPALSKNRTGSLEESSFYGDKAEPSPLSLWKRFGIWSLVFRRKVRSVIS